MNWAGALLWGFVGTVVLTGAMSAGQGFGLSRLGMPYLLGTMFTADRDRAKLVGFGVHLLNGWLFAVVYAAAFESWRRATWWRGAAIGLVHALFVLVAGMRIVSSMHPRMASELRGPTPTRQLEPPGFLALNYGRRTPLSVVLAHVVYGAVLGAFYRPRSAEVGRLGGPLDGTGVAAVARPSPLDRRQPGPTERLRSLAGALRPGG